MVTKRYIEILLIVAMMLPLIHDLNTIEDDAVVVIANEHYLDEADDTEGYTAPPKTLSLQILLKATILRRFSVVRIKMLRLLRQRPIIRSESPRHSELRTGDVSTFRI